MIIPIMSIIIYLIAREKGEIGRWISQTYSQ
jgi:hypothetical protein